MLYQAENFIDFFSKSIELRLLLLDPIFDYGEERFKGFADLFAISVGFGVIKLIFVLVTAFLGGLSFGSVVWIIFVVALEIVVFIVTRFGATRNRI